MTGRYEPPPPFGRESDEWIQRFGQMTVNGTPAPLGDQGEDAFVGGFSSSRSHKPLPAVPVDQAWQTPAMRMPEPARRTSLTMQHALGTPPSFPVPPLLRPGASPATTRPYSAPTVQAPASPVSIGKLPNPNSPPATPPASGARRNTGSALRPPAAPSSAGRAHSAPGAPGKSPKAPKTPVRAGKGKRRASSTSISIDSDDSEDVSPPSSPSGTGTPSRDGQKVACAGRTVKGTPCKRGVKIGADEDPDVPRLCHQHAKTTDEVTVMYARGNGELIQFSDWIPDYLSQYTRNALKVEMERATSKGEEPGYIYTFQIEDSSTPGVAHLKVGRTVNLTQRIHQWARQCGSRPQTLRGYWPGTVQAAGPDEDDEVTTLLRGHVDAKAAGKGSHRLERLIHLELADLVDNAQYLDANWPKAPSTPPSTPKKTREKCDDCGTTHKEIFSFTRGKGKYKNKEWELIVMPVINKWGTFVEQYC